MRAALVETREDGVGASYDALAVLVPDCAPTLAVTRRVALTPCPAVHTSDVSDVHAAASHALPPTRARAL